MYQTSPSSDEYWTSKTRWYSAVLDVDNVATILGLQGSTMRQYVARSQLEGFPEPLARGRSNGWSLDQVFQFIDQYKPQLRHLIPRLYCLPGPMNPAVFLRGEEIVIDDRLTPVRFGVHFWQPSDRRGEVAVAYPESLDEPGWRFTADLLAHKALERATAVILVTNEIQMTPQHEWQASIAVLERHDVALPPNTTRHPIGDPSRPKVVIPELGWYDLANLLRTDVPWWPPALRDIAQVIRWRPGTPRQHIRIQDRSYNEAMLRDVASHCPPAHSEAAINLADRINRIVEDRWYSAYMESPSLPVGERCERPGLIQAAEARFLIPVPPTPSYEELAWLLHLEVDDALVADKAIGVLDASGACESLIASAVVIDDQSGPLAKRWLAAAKPVKAADRSQLGYAFARMNAAGYGPIDAWLAHPQDENTWIVVTKSGTAVATVGTAVPANGRLVEFELGSYGGFFKDSSDQVWPLPFPKSGGYSSGHEGTGPADLVSTVVALRRDAASDIVTVTRPPNYRSLPLWRYVVRTSTPFHVSQSDFASLVDSSTPQESSPN
ncbi:hypothetical protein HGA11_07190 [Mycolicibacterium septicum DSM 44393]|uniref:Uncharacterized protein n=1 Tax=Mycolicibacterium septicum DSM 44393 TaxID=1341646 RepID=A0A7X6RVJ7_9MYCO|nr:hypothetical protein [Mycolicibacterium septicum]NKZ10761.1 hypothetical protein [Mycolicibacterium septicum DSM 44393]